MGVVYDEQNDWITNGAWEHSVNTAIESAISVPAFYHLEGEVSLD